MKVDKNPAGTYTCTPTAAEAALLAKVEARFAPATVQELLRQVISSWLISHEVRFHEELLALYDTLPPEKKERVRALLEGV